MVSLFVSITFSVISAIVTYIYGFNLYECITTAFLIFLSSEFAFLVWNINKIRFAQKEENNFLKTTNPYTLKLQEINEYFSNIIRDSHGSEDLFLVTCSKSIDNLHSLSREASIDKKIEISSDYVINVNGVFEALNVTKDKTVKMTFPIIDFKDDIIPTPEDKKFFEAMYEKTQSNEISAIEILVRIPNEDLLDNEQLKKLFDFYSANKKYECKYILQRDFIEVCKNNKIPTSSLDFGIYGSKILFVVEKLIPYSGIYYKDDQKIKRYTELFDEIWTFSAMTKTNPSTIANGKSISPKDFFSNVQSIRKG